jgi:hypothetical protein
LDYSRSSVISVIVGRNPALANNARAAAFLHPMELLDDV